MALFGGNIENLSGLYTTQLRYLLSTEEQIIDALPEMITAASDQQLKDALQSHLQETEIHAERLEDILSELTGDVDSKKCAVTAALISAGETTIKASEDFAVRDVGIIASAQKIEHFEMASYGTLRNWARLLGYNEQAAILEKTLKEEGHADQLLTTISDRANPSAVMAA
jgi:ferritin-like metal-binding protein YciE